MPEPALNGMNIAILATDGFEQSELLEPRKALTAAGATEADPKDFDALVLPGGVMNPDTLRTQPKAVAFVKAFFDADKPVAAICHGPWTVIESGAARGRRMTSWPSLKTDIENARAQWVDQEVVVDRNLVTSHKPDDLPAFNREIIRVIGQARTTGGRSLGAHAGA